MAQISRRDLLAGLTASGAASIMPPRTEASHNSVRENEAALSSEQRRKHADSLPQYFAEHAPQLLRAPEGILKYPSVAPSLPGKTYSTNLLDWDTLWTSQGLFRLATLQSNKTLRQRLCEHVSGSVLNFLDHASPDGQIPIMMTATDPDPFRIVGKNAISRNQAKPVFGQLGLLASDQRGDAQWLATHFDVILRFYEAWTKHPQACWSGATI